MLLPAAEAAIVGILYKSCKHSGSMLIWQTTGGVVLFVFDGAGFATSIPTLCLGNEGMNLYNREKSVTHVI